MKEMVSSRGVAKKRRKQEVGEVVNQMFAYCCGHATIVARRQPYLGTSSPAARLTSMSPRLARPHPGGLQPVSDRKKSFSNARFTAPHHATKLNLATAQASPGIAKRNSNHIPAADARSIPLRCAHRKLRRLTSIVFERDRVIFVWPALFALFFVT
jgi:hypothetical protein